MSKPIQDTAYSCVDGMDESEAKNVMLDFINEEKDKIEIVAISFTGSAWMLFYREK